MTLLEAYRLGADRLAKAGVPDAEIDAGYLLEWASGATAAHRMAYPDEIMKADCEKRYLEAVRIRTERVPMQHITGSQWFMGLEFRVSGDVLIPRQDTETLVEEALKRLQSGMRLLDLCTGSGCILLSLLHECGGVTGIGSDVSEAALDVARDNAKRLGISAEFIKSDIFDNIDGEFDVITSNPPYIRTADIAELMPEVRDYEPKLALDGQKDGLYFYRRICATAPSHIKEGGALCMEIGCDQAADVVSMMAENGFSDIKVIKDLSGNDRVVCGRKV